MNGPPACGSSAPMKCEVVMLEVIGWLAATSFDHAVSSGVYSGSVVNTRSTSLLSDALNASKYVVTTPSAPAKAGGSACQPNDAGVSAASVASSSGVSNCPPAQSQSSGLRLRTALSCAVVASPSSRTPAVIAFWSALESCDDEQAKLGMAASANSSARDERFLGMGMLRSGSASSPATSQMLAQSAVLTSAVPDRGARSIRKAAWGSRAPPRPFSLSL